MKLSKITLTLSLFSTLASSVAIANNGVKVQPIQSTVTEETFQTLIVAKALQALDYDVQPIKEVDYNVAYTSVANGDATFMAVNWDPLHTEKYQKAGGDKVFYRKGHYVTGATQGYLVDKKTADKYKITNLVQLKDPKIAALFDADGDGKADLTGCTPGWGCETRIEEHLDAFGLRDTVNHNQGNYSAIIADTIARYKSGNPIIYYTWTPYWVSGELVPGKDVVWIQVPSKGIEGKPLIDTKLSNGKNYGFNLATMNIVVNKKFAEAHPDAAKLFSIMKLNVNDINAENMLMRKGQNTQKDIERHADLWIKGHQEIFNSWIEEAKSAK